MFDVGNSLQPGLARGEALLRAAQTRVAEANAGRNGRGADAAMAETAKAAIFTEALLSAVRARLSEIKAVTK
jgi:hypothetical protein